MASLPVGRDYLDVVVQHHVELTVYAALAVADNCGDRRGGRRSGLSALPICVQEFLRELIFIDREENVEVTLNLADSQAATAPQFDQD
jgi:hypothetical protein